MELRALLKEVREHYVQRLRGAIASFQAEEGMQVATEVALRDETGQVIVEGALDLPMRVDAVLFPPNGDPEALTVEEEVGYGFAPRTFTWDGLEVILGPFSWQDLLIKLADVPEDVDWSPLRDWFVEWFREEEDGDGHLLGVIHFLSDPELAGESRDLVVDLGSAPVEAFEGLLDAIAAVGVTQAELGDLEGL